MADAPLRVCVVAVPDWPVLAAGATAAEPAAVFAADRVVASSPTARDEGVEPGQRRREAQRRCPSLSVFEVDHDRDARVFGPLVGSLDRFTPRIELSRPGWLAFASDAPSRYLGGDGVLATAVLDAIDAQLLEAGWAGAVGVGIADGRFAAERAALRAVGGDPCVVAPGRSPEFLARLPIAELGDPDLVDVLSRLGLRSLGAFAALDVGDVIARFGAIGRDAHRLARGGDRTVPNPVPLPVDLDAVAVLDPPAERVDVVAFAARTAAEELHRRLADDGLSCAHVSIALDAECGARIERIWRAEDSLTAAAIVDRVRWQVDGWLHGPVGARPAGGVMRVVLSPVEVHAATGRQRGFWGGEVEADERADRALARVQGLLGPGAVTVLEVRGGRGPSDRVVRVPFAGVDTARVVHRPSATAPWPGRIPDPSATLVPAERVAIAVFDVGGRPITVDGRGAPSGAPVRVVIDPRGSAVDDAVTSWAGPWPCDERWWDHDTHRRRARMQLVLGDGRAVLAAIEGGRWFLEASHD